MEPKHPMIWARVDAKTASEVQKLADEHYDGNLSVLVRLAVKRFAEFLKKVEAIDQGPDEAAA